MVKLFSYILLVTLLVSCQKESLIVQEETINENFVLDAELSGLVLSVSAHDGSFDDVLDNAGCFSVQFPYTIQYNGELFEINSINDLLGIKSGQEVLFQYPINITYSDYFSTTINSISELNNAITSCATNQTFLSSIKCVDFIYPIRIATYNSTTNSFNTLVIDHDQQNFTTIKTILQEQLAEVRFPLSLQLANGEALQISNVQELKDIIYQNSQNCE